MTCDYCGSKLHTIETCDICCDWCGDREAQLKLGMEFHTACNCPDKTGTDINMISAVCSAPIAFVNKLLVCVLLTQFGKTFTAIKKIKADIEENPNSIACIFTMNTKLAGEQFASRLQEFKTTYGENSVLIFNSDTKYKGPFAHTRDLKALRGIVWDPETRPKIIIMCSNKKRFTDGVEFIRSTNNGGGYGISGISIYYDEMHAYLSNNLREQIEVLNNFQIVNEIIGMTASPDPIWMEGDPYWSSVNLLYLDDFDTASYVGAGDMDWNEVNDFEQFAEPYRAPGCMNHKKKKEETIGFADHVLNKFPSILDAGNRVFCPAHVAGPSHVAMRDLLFKNNKNIVVVVIAGEQKNALGKKLYYYETDAAAQSTVPMIPKYGEEFSQTLTRVLSERHLNDRCVVITGHICIGMGQTFTTPEFGSFTHAIIAHMDLTNELIYQLFGRLTGRMKPTEDNKNWTAPYVPTKVFCTTTVMNRISGMEVRTRVLAEKASSEEGATCTQAEYRQHDGPDISGNFTKPKKQKKVKEPLPEFTYLYPHFDGEEIVIDGEGKWNREMPEKLHWFSNEIDPISLKSGVEKSSADGKIFAKLHGPTKKYGTFGDGNIRTAFDKKLRKITDSKIIPTNKGLDNGHAAGNGVYHMLVQNNEETHWTILQVAPK